MRDFKIDTDKIRSSLVELGYNLQDRGSEWRTAAIYRNGDNSTSLKIDKETGNWKDFVTGAYGTIFDLIKRTNPLININEIKEKILHGESFSETGEQIQKDKINYQTIYSSELLKKLHNNHEYWINRGISNETMSVFKGGVVYKGKMAGRYVFPIFDLESNIVGFSGRTIHPNGLPKWKHIGNKAMWEYPLLFSSKEIEKKGYLIIVESIGDMLSLWESGTKNTVVSFGVSGLNILMYKLVNMGVKICIAFNDDSKKDGGNLAGNRAAVSFARQMVATKLIDKENVKIIKPSKNDFGDMSKEENIEWTCRAERILFKK